MVEKIYFEHYRLVVDENNNPRELTRTGEAITYRAIDLRSGESTAVTRLPISAIPSDMRETFEERARATAKLDHPNIARLLAFGTEGEDFILVSEFLQGESIGRWVALRGPLPPDAALRTALQVTNALSAAKFEGLNHPAIQPSNVLIVPGEATEGGWPYVKVTNFALAGIKLEAMPQFASPEQLKGAPVDFRSEVYSIGATMWFMLTGAIPGAQDRVAETRLVRKLPKSLRAILAQTLQPDPAQRPDTPMAFTEELVDAMGTVDRRQALGKKLGIPIAVPMTGAASPSQRRKFPVMPLAIAAVIIALLAVGAVLRPDRLLHKSRSAETVGVPVGVTDAAGSDSTGDTNVPAPSPVVESTNVAAAAPTVTQPVAQAVASPAASPRQLVGEVAARPEVVEQAPAQANNGVSSDTTNIGTDTAANGVASASAPAPVRAPASADAPKAKPEPAAKSRTARKSEDEDTRPKAVVARRSAKPSRDSVAKDDDGMPPLSVGSVRAKFVGTTPDGKWILALPNSETVVVPPPPFSKRGKEAARRKIPRAEPVEEETTVDLDPQDFTPRR